MKKFLKLVVAFSVFILVRSCKKGNGSKSDKSEAKFFEIIVNLYFKPNFIS